MSPDREDIIKNYDHVLHQSLGKIFRESCLSSSQQIKEFLWNLQHYTDQNFTQIKLQILEQEPFISKQFSKKELGKLSLLWIAVLARYQKSAELLLRCGADVNELFGSHEPQLIDEKTTILHALLQMDPTPENKRLIRMVILDCGADLEARGNKGQTALHFSVLEDRVQETEMLLEKGADVNVVGGDDSKTPLLIAASNRKANVLLPLLIKHGADVFVKDTYYQNALHLLADLTSYDEQYEHTVGLARILIDKGVSFDDKDYCHNYQPIHLAALNGNDELVKLFLDHGANVNVQNRDGESPLYLALYQHEKPAVVETLLKRGANINLRTVDGSTALHNACDYVQYRKEYLDIIRLLVSAGADVFAEDSMDRTPFAVMSSSGNTVNPATRFMIRVLALKKVSQPSIELKDEKIIKRYRKTRNHYRKCIKEVDRIKFTRFIETCTFFKLLTKNQCQIAALMQNPEFESKFSLYDLNRFPIYAEDVLEAFERAQDHYRSLLEQENVINEAVYNILPYLVVKKVVRYIFNGCCSKNVK